MRHLKTEEMMAMREREARLLDRETGPPGNRSVSAIPISQAVGGGSGPTGGGYGNVNPADYSGFQGCVIARESSGQSQVMNSTGHYGLYQFDASTWAEGGGNPADFGHATVAEQTAVFWRVYQMRGTEPWAPSDGC